MPTIPSSAEKKRSQLQLSNEKINCIGYRRDYTTQLCGFGFWSWKDFACASSKLIDELLILGMVISHIPPLNPGILVIGLEQPLYYWVEKFYPILDFESAYLIQLKGALKWTLTCTCHVCWYESAFRDRTTPWKINMEHNPGGLEDDIPFQMGDL